MRLEYIDMGMGVDHLTMSTSIKQEGGDTTLDRPVELLNSRQRRQEVVVCELDHLYILFSKHPDRTVRLSRRRHLIKLHCAKVNIRTALRLAKMRTSSGTLFAATPIFRIGHNHSLPMLIQLLGPNLCEFKPSNRLLHD